MALVLLSGGGFSVAAVLVELPVQFRHFLSQRSGLGFQRTQTVGQLTGHDIRVLYYGGEGY